MTHEEELTLGQELDKTNSMLRVTISKNEYYKVGCFFSGIGTNNIKVGGITIVHYYMEDGHLQHHIYRSTLNNHPEVLRDFETAIETDKYEIIREYFNY